MTGSPEDEGGFLDRWSRRKRAAEAEPVIPQADTEPETPEVSEDEITPEELAALPAPEEITRETDIVPFLKRGVPRALKNAALRRSWMLNPAIRDHRDLAVDYAWDWNVAGGVPGSGGPLSNRSIADLLQRMGQGATEAEAQEPARAAERPEEASSLEADAQDEATTDTDPPEDPPVPSDFGKPEDPNPDAPRRHGRARPV